MVLDELIVLLGLDSDDYDRGIQSSTSKTEKFVNETTGRFNRLAAVVAGGGAAFVAFAAVAEKSFIGFQQSMSEVFTLIPDASSGALNQMTQQVKDFSVQFGVLPEKTIPALYQSLSAGIPADNVFKFLEDAQRAAVAGVTDLTTSVEGISSVINAYGQQNISAAQASDIMFTTVRLGKTKFDELSASLFNVLPVAASLRVAFGDMSAALAAMTLQGVPTSVATTQLRQMLVELGNSGSQVGKIFQKVAGESFKQFIASGGTLQQALQLLEGSTKGTGKGINELFGSVEAGSAALALTGTGTQAFSNALEAMGHSAGATQKAYNTMNSTISASLNKLKAVGSVALISIGEKLAPAIGKLADAAVKLGQSKGFATFIDAVGTAMARGIDLILAFGTTAINLARQALGWGNAIGTNFAKGILDAAKAVVAALQQLGSIIAHWLRPGSPPLITPGLDQWGEDAANVYMAGWANADFSALNDLGNQIEGILKGLVDTKQLGQGDMLSLLIGSRGNLAKGIDEISRLGDISQSTFDSIVSSLGPAGSQVGGLIRAYADLARATSKVRDAQTELNRVTQEYDAKLGPLQAQLKQVEDKKQAIEDQKRLGELQAKVADDSLDDNEKQQAQLEIQEIQLRQQIKAVEDERDTAVDAAQAKLNAATLEQTAAQEKYDQQQALIEQSNKLNSLLSQQTQLAESAAKGAGGVGGGADIGGMPALPDISTQLEPITTAANTINTDIGKINQRFMEMNTAFETAESTVAATFGSMSTAAGGFIGTLETLFAPAINSFTERFNILKAIALNAWEGISSAFTGKGPAIVASATATFQSVVSFINTTMTSANAIVNAILEQIAYFFAANGESIGQTVYTAWQQIQIIIQTALAILQMIIPPILATIAAFITAHGDSIQNALRNAWTIISTIITTVLAVIRGVLQAVLAAMHGDWRTAWTNIQAVCAQILTSVGKIIGTALDLIANLWGTSIKGLIDLWRNNWNMAKEIIIKVTALILRTLLDWADKASSIGSALVAGIQEGISDAWESFKNWVSSKVASLVQTMKDAVKIGSPSKVVADEVGEPIIQGLMSGMAGLIPSLLAQASDHMSQLVKTMGDKGEEAAKAFNDKIVGALNFRASLPRLLDDITQLGQSITDELTKSLQSGDFLGNLAVSTKIKTLIDQVNNQIATAMAQAQSIAAAGDTAGAGRFLQLRQQQIEEMAKLQEDLLKASSQADRTKIETRIARIGEAQQLELQALLASLSANPELAQALAPILNQSGVPNGVGTTTTNNNQAQTIIQIDAKGSTLTEDQIKALFLSALREIVNNGSILARLGLTIAH
jgi:TP901 family phage tail tape measure protein